MTRGAGVYIYNMTTTDKWQFDEERLNAYAVPMISRSINLISTLGQVASQPEVDRVD